MKVVLAWALLAALALHLAAHVGLAIVNAREPGRGSALRALAGFFLPPLGFWRGLEAGHRRLAFTWLGTLAAYALGVALA